MTIKLDYYHKKQYLVFELPRIVKLNDIKEVFSILSKKIKSKQTFVFMLNGKNVEEFPTFSAGYFIISWMKEHCPIIPNVLLGSAIILKNETIISILKWVFSIQKPVSPNIITNNIQEGNKFLKQYITKLNLKKNIANTHSICNLHKERKILEEQNEKKREGMRC